MSLNWKFNFITLVLLLGNQTYGAPSSQIYRDSPLPSAHAPQANAPMIPSKWKLFKSSNNVSIGILSLQKGGDSKELSSLHFSRSQYNSDNSAQEFGVDILSNSYLGWNINYKKIMTPFRYAEPAYKIGIQAIYRPEDELANLVNYERYYLRFGLVFDDLLSFRRRSRVEAFSSVGAMDFAVGVKLTWAFPDKY